MSFRDRAIVHLIEYKHNVLNVTEPGRWKRNGKEYAHILPEGMLELNLLEGYRSELMAYIRDNKIRLHKDFHHLNSSQALCLNFFYPMLADNQMHLLLELLHCEDEGYETCMFERVSEIDGTNFDFSISLKSGREIYFEIKYSENRFGSVKDKEQYRRKYKEVYRKQLTGKIRDSVHEYQALLDHYQLMRNISHVNAESDDLLIIICPKDRSKLLQEFNIVMEQIVEPKLHDKIRLITWETIMQRLNKKLEQTSNIPDRLKAHYSQLEEKYFILDEPSA